MQIDMSISLGHIITLVGVFITVITWGNNIKWQITAIETRLGRVEEDLKKITDLIITTGNLGNQLGHLETRLARLERIALDHIAEGRKTHETPD